MGVALPTFFIVWHKGTECVCKIWGGHIRRWKLVGGRISRCLRLLCTAKREEKEACKRMEQEGARKGQLEQGPVLGSCIMQEVGEEDEGRGGQQNTWKRKETRQERGWFRFLSCLPLAHLQKPGFFFLSKLV